MLGVDEGDSVRQQRQGAAHRDRGPARTGAVQQRLADCAGRKPAVYRI